MRILISFVISALACLALSGSGEDSQMVHVLDQESVLKVTGIQYDGHSYRASKYNWLIMFQVSWCEVCKATLPTWMQLADTLTKHVNSDRKFHQTRMAVVDCDKNFALCQQFMIEGYPTFLYVAPEGIFKFQGYRTVQVFIKFLQGDYLNSPKIIIKELSITNLLLQLFHKVGLVMASVSQVTIVAIVFIATWLAYLCSGIFIKNKEEHHLIQSPAESVKPRPDQPVEFKQKKQN